jgi:uncharacterized protein YjbI with pentapeptide repeats
LFLVMAAPPRVIRASRPDIRTASAADQLKAENDLRTTIVTMLAGVAVATGTVVAALNFRETQRQNRQSSELQRRGQVTERFTKAIDQLGNSDQLDVRIGGIYALEQIARDAAELHWPIVEILTALIREHTKRDAGARVRSEQPERDQEIASSRKVAADIQGALTVLGRRNSDRHLGRVDLGEANLQGAQLEGANLQDAYLRGANLQEAYLEEANLQGAQLEGVNLQDAYLGVANVQEAIIGEANLQGANLREANLQGAILAWANLKGTYLGGANLQDAILQEAILSEANLQGANLAEANLQGANLSGANVKGVDLSDTVGLTQEQLNSVNCDENTKPPPGLTVNVKPTAHARAEQAEHDDRGRNQGQADETGADPRSEG